MKAIILAIFALLLSTSALAEEKENADKAQEIALQQKLSKVYDLYRKDQAVSLKPDEYQAGIGLNYSASDKDTLGMRQSTRGLATQAFIGRGLGNGMQITLSAPFIMQLQRAETVDSVLGSKSISGFGDPTVRFMATLPTTDFTTTMFASTTLPLGNKIFAPNGIHTSLGINLDKVLRPAFVTGGLSLEHDWGSGTNGVGYNMGFGFFLNQALSVGAGLNGVLVLNPQMGMARDNASFNLKVAYQATPTFGIVGSTNFGLTNDTPPVSIGATAYWRF